MLQNFRSPKCYSMITECKRSCSRSSKGSRLPTWPPEDGFGEFQWCNPSRLRCPCHEPQRAPDKACTRRSPSEAGRTPRSPATHADPRCSSMSAQPGRKRCCWHLGLLPLMKIASVFGPDRKQRVIRPRKKEGHDSQQSLFIFLS
jgi:hypothetical protein